MLALQAMIIPVGFQLSVPIHELECDYVRSSGPGGQNVNKVNSKCVMRWSVATTPSLPEPVRARFMERFASRLTLEGELVLTSDRFRDQRRNFEDCLEKAQTMLDSVLRPPKPRVKTKPSKGSKRRRLSDKRAHSEKKAARIKPRD
jgi:ribosome-associated protein